MQQISYSQVAEKKEDRQWAYSVHNNVRKVVSRDKDDKGRRNRNGNDVARASQTRPQIGSRIPEIVTG